MWKLSLVMSFVFLLGLFGCSQGNKHSDKVVFKASKEVNMITVTENGLAVYFETEERLIEREVVLGQTKEIEVILKAIEDCALLGSMTDEGAQVEFKKYLVKKMYKISLNC